MDPIEPVEVYSTFNPADAELVRVMLEAEGIEATVEGATQGGFPGALPEVTVMVHSKDADEARELIRDHKAKAAATADDEDEEE